MKNYLKIIISACSMLFIQQCTAQDVGKTNAVTELITNEEFTFHAERANPINFDVLNVLNSMSNAPATRILQLDGEGYIIEIKKDKLEVVLPYFGRVFNPSYGNVDNSYRFTSKDFSVTKTKGRKGRFTFKIKPKDARSVSDINIEVYPNGKAFTSIKSNDRQPITYDGYISKNEEPKEKSSQ